MGIDLTSVRRPITATISAFALLLASNASAQGLPTVDSDGDGDGVADDIDAAPCDPTVSARQFVPADRTYGMMMFEDLWPARGDFDFNDAVISYNQVLLYDSYALLTGIRMELSVMAVGASFTNGLAFRLPGVPAESITFLSSSTRNVPNSEEANVRLDPNETDATIIIADDLHALFGLPGGTMINTVAGQDPAPYADIVLEVRFAPGAALSSADAPYDIFIFNQAHGSEVHRPQYGGTAAMNHDLFNTVNDGSSTRRRFVTTEGIPFALDLPELVNYPRENEPIDRLYPAIVQFGHSGGNAATDFYRQPAMDTAYGIVPPRPLAAQVAPDLSCFAPDPGACGSASGTGSVDVPEAELCDVGAPSVVQDSGGMWRWTCAGTYSQPTECTAPRQACASNLPAPCSSGVGTGVHWCNGSGSGYGQCLVNSCDEGYFLHDVGGVKVCSPQNCTPGETEFCWANESGKYHRTCSNLGETWSPCMPVACEPGYTREGSICVPIPTGITRWSAGTMDWPDQACNVLFSFGFCNTNNRGHANAWATEVCTNNGYSSGEWTGRKWPGCSGNVSMYCRGQIPCEPTYEYRCNIFDQTRVEVRCLP